MQRIALFACLLVSLFSLTACQDSDIGSPVFHAEGKPTKLSDWNILDLQGVTLEFADRVVAYDLNTPLFSDYAHKLRTVWVPTGEAAVFDATDTFKFPIGTIISKTFYYPRSQGQDDSSVLKALDETAEKLVAGLRLDEVKLIETRLLVRREAGWVALPYVWNASQTEAVLKRTGDIKQLSLVDYQAKQQDKPQGKQQDFAYVVPNENQCAGCHATNATTREIIPIGPKARHLDKDYVYKSGRSNQLTAWVDQGLLTGLPNSSTDGLAKEVESLNAWSKNALWGDDSQSLDHRARSYLDINCSHCHNAVGPADTSGLLLEPTDKSGQSLGLCKLPIAAGTGTGNRKFGIVPGKPDESIFTFRLESTLPSVMMPELGRSLSHSEGVALIREWIANMPGRCD